MIEYFFNSINPIIYESLALFPIFFAISFFWNKIHTSLSLKPYQSKQRLHKDEVPRVGGLIIYLFLTIVAFLTFDSQLLNIILISTIPIIFIGAKEDLFHNTSPKLRLIIMIVSSFLFIYLLPTKLPEIEFPIISQFLSFSIINEAFFIFSILVIMNGNNLIDGVNGNMALANMVQLVVILLLAIHLEDRPVVDVCLIIMAPLIIFFIFNFPFGKIFSGDAGAYFYGFSISALVIYLFGKYEQLLSWSAILILIYPSVELLFSFIRKKMFENKSPFTPDKKHLHSLIFRYVSKKFNLTNNSFVMIFLLPIIFSPFLAHLYIDEIIYVIFSIFMIFIYYIFMYLYFVNLVSKND